MHGARSEADKAGDMVGRPRLSRLNHDRGTEADAGVDQVVVHGADRDQRRNEDVVDAHAALLEVREHDHFGAAAHLRFCLGDEGGDGGLQPLGPRCDRIEGRDRRRLLRLRNRRHLVRI